jgi:GTP1/Obg family GTP-binding protein
LRQFADMERRRIAIVKTANNRTESQNREINRLRNQCEQQEQTIGRFREQVNSLNQVNPFFIELFLIELLKEKTSSSQQFAEFRLEKSSLLLEKDRFHHEIEGK